MSVQVSYKKQSLLGILFILIIFGAIEGVLRVYDITETQCSFKKTGVFDHLNENELNQLCKVHHSLEFDPITKQFFPNQDLGNVKINNLGFRGNDISIEKPTDTYRIFVIGGSTTFGVVVDNDETIPTYLQNYFNNIDSKYKIEVINAGVNSGWSFNEVTQINNKIISLNPDLLIIYDGWNDVEHGRPEFLLDPSQYTAPIYTDDISPIEYAKHLLRQVHTIQTINRIIFYANNEDLFLLRTVVPFDSSHLDLKVQEWNSRWSTVCDFGKINGFDTIITIQPMAGMGNKTMSDTEYFYYVRYDHENLFKGFQKYVDSMDNLKTHCAKTVDLRNIFDGIDQPIFFDQGHVGPVGNKIIAKKLFDISLPIIKNITE
jgi:hypothetical protein